MVATVLGGLPVCIAVELYNNLTSARPTTASCFDGVVFTNMTKCAVNGVVTKGWYPHYQQGGGSYIFEINRVYN